MNSSSIPGISLAEIRAKKAKQNSGTGSRVPYAPQQSAPLEQRIQPQIHLSRQVMQQPPQIPTQQPPQTASSNYIYTHTQSVVQPYRGIKINVQITTDAKQQQTMYMFGKNNKLWNVLRSFDTVFKNDKQKNEAKFVYCLIGKMK